MTILSEHPRMLKLYALQRERGEAMKARQLAVARAYERAPSPTLTR